MLFLLLLALGLAIAGLTAYMMSWPLVATQLRDRHTDLRAQVGDTPFSPAGFFWLLRRGYRQAHDSSLNFLGLPATIGAWGIVIGGAAAAVLFLARVSGVAL
ncbi:MAG: hypothetical protein ABI411_12075 [Tahibacter sp.]